MIANLGTTKKILNKYNLQAKKKFGQNFLIDANIIEKIALVSDINKECGVIEIGPGIGSLTEKLCEKAKKVLCYEIDSDMINILNENLEYDNFKIVNKDFLKVDLKDDLAYFSDCECVKVISNLPYYITTPIIFKLLEEKSCINEFYFMAQKEVGERLCGKVNTKDYNSLSVLIDFQANAHISFLVGRNSFYPSPNVDSAIIAIKKEDKNYGICDRDKFLKFVQNIFALRRKTFVNNMTNKYNISKEEIINILEKNGYKATLRSEELTTSEIVKLYNEFFVNR